MSFGHRGVDMGHRGGPRQGSAVALEDWTEDTPKGEDAPVDGPFLPPGDTWTTVDSEGLRSSQVSDQPLNGHLGG